jgi:MFS superfamily sulfate permease-like transporter
VILQIRAYKEIILCLLCFIGTFFLGPELGILLALIASLYLVVRHTTLPNVAVLGRTSKGQWKDIASFPSARIIPGILVIRIAESLYFGNIEQLKDMITRIGMKMLCSDSKMPRLLTKLSGVCGWRVLDR